MIVRLRAPPHVSVGIHEEITHTVFRIDERILRDVPGGGVKLAHNVGVHRRITRCDLADWMAHGIGGRVRSRQVIFLEGARLGIKAGDFFRAILADPQRMPLVAEVHAARISVGGRKRKLRDFVRDWVDLADLSVLLELRKPRGFLSVQE